MMNMMNIKKMKVIRNDPFNSKIVKNANKPTLKNILHKETASTKYLATLTHFWPMFPFYTPQKKFSGVFRGIKIWTLARNRLNSILT